MEKEGKKKASQGVLTGEYSFKQDVQLSRHYKSDFE